MKIQAPLKLMCYWDKSRHSKNGISNNRNKVLKDQVNNLEKQSSDSEKDIQEKTKKAEFSEDQLRVALKQEIGQV